MQNGTCQRKQQCCLTSQSRVEMKDFRGAQVPGADKANLQWTSEAARCSPFLTQQSKLTSKCMTLCWAFSAFISLLFQTSPVIVLLSFSLVLFSLLSSFLFSSTSLKYIYWILKIINVIPALCNKSNNTNAHSEK